MTLRSMKYAEVLGSKMAYLDEGIGKLGHPLHSSYTAIPRPPIFGGM
jgi:hypothetical protein